MQCQWQGGGGAEPLLTAAKSALADMVAWSMEWFTNRMT